MSRTGLRAIVEDEHIDVGSPLVVRVGDDPVQRPVRVVWTSPEPDGTIVGLEFFEPLPEGLVIEREARPSDMAPGPRRRGRGEPGRRRAPAEPQGPGSVMSKAAAPAACAEAATVAEIKKALVAAGLEIYRTRGQVITLADRVRENLLMDAGAFVGVGEALRVGLVIRAQASDFPGEAEAQLFERARAVAARGDPRRLPRDRRPGAAGRRPRRRGADPRHVVRRGAREIGGRHPRRHRRGAPRRRLRQGGIALAARLP